MADEAENSNEFEISLEPSFHQSVQEAKGKDETQTIPEIESKTSDDADRRTDELNQNEQEAEQEEPEFLDAVEAPLKEISGMTEVTPDDDEQESGKSSQAPTESTRHSKTGSIEMSEAEGPQESVKLPKEEAELDKEFEIMQEMGPRIRPSMEDEEFLAGFEIDADIIIALDDISPEEEQSIVEVEEEIAVLDRAPYYERHDKAYEMMGKNKIKNLLLQKKLSMYFKRKKMDDATRETDWSFDQQNKYFRKLELYGELIEYAQLERETTNKDIEVTKAHRESKFKELTAKFKKMQSREGEIGYGLINTKTGNVIPDKLVQRLINRQSLQMEQVCSMRLKFIKLKQMVQEKMDAISILDEVAPGFLLAEYEHLKILNQGFADKIEEREEELVRLRAKCVNSIQMLAHIREKSAAMQNDLQSLKDDLAEADDEVTQVRWRLNSIKKQRETYRQSLTKLQNDCGLLTKPTLLRDMEQGLIDVKVLSANLELVIEEHKKRAKQIKAIRKKIEMANEMRHFSRKGNSRVANMSRSANNLNSTIYKGRPSLLIPIIEDDAFCSLKSIKPKITYDRRRYDGGIKHKRTEG